MQVTKIFECCIGHRLINYKGKCANVHGHNLRIEVTVGTRIPFTIDNLDQQGMLIDFGILKTLFKTYVDEQLDHGFAVNNEDATMITFLFNNGQKFYIVRGNPTMENIASTLKSEFQHILRRELPDRGNLFVQSVKIWESNNGYVEC